MDDQVVLVTSENNNRNPNILLASLVIAMGDNHLLVNSFERISDDQIQIKATILFDNVEEQLTSQF